MEHEVARRHRWSAPARGGWIVGLAVLAVLIGAVTSRSALAGAALTALALFVAGIAWRGRYFPLEVGFAVLPWLVVLSANVPEGVATAIAGAAVAYMFVLRWPALPRSLYVRVGLLLFGAVVVIQGLYAGQTDQRIEVAKYLVFAGMVVLLLSPSGAAQFRRVGPALLLSSVGALAVSALISALGIGAAKSYYGVGESLGSATSPHQLALLALVTGGAIASLRARWYVQVSGLILAVGVGIATGVRTAVVAAGALILAMAARVGTLRATVIVAIVAVALMAGGVASTVIERTTGGFTSVSAENAGVTQTNLASARTDIWNAALTGWAEGGAQSWIGGRGLRSIEGIELEKRGDAFASHSDVVQVLVEDGLIAFVGWILLWIGLVSGRCQLTVIAPLAAFAVLNGTFDYVGPLVVGLALAAPGGIEIHPLRPRTS